ncbi:hypothetical protein ACFX2I_040486 [Malus domestica]
MSVKKKLKTSSIIHEGLLAAERPVIDMISSNRKKTEAARSEPVAPAMSRMASMIADMITQCRGLVMPLVPKSVPRCQLGAKSDSHLERLAIKKSDKWTLLLKWCQGPLPLLE